MEKLDPIIVAPYDENPELSLEKDLTEIDDPMWRKSRTDSPEAKLEKP
jgi:hypothetical protein